MSLSHSSSAVRDGVVLNLDVMNQKSYSPNAHPKSTNLYSWVTTANNATLSRDTITSPVGTTPLKMLVTSTDPFTSSYSAPAWNLAPALVGSTWTVSVWVKADAVRDVSIFIFGADSGGTAIESNVGYRTATPTWTRISHTYTLTNGACAFVQARLDGPDTGGVGTIWWDGMQVEAGSTASTFNPNNYGPTVWKDLSGRDHHATLYNAPVLSGGCLQFRTASTQYATAVLDEGVMKSTNENGSWTMEAVFRHVSAGTGSESFIVGRTGCHGGIYEMGSNLLTYDIKTDQCWTGYSSVSAGTMAIGGAYHAVMVYVNGTTYGYLNGQYLSSSTINLITYGISAYADTLWISGFSTNGLYSTNSDISVIRCYNRALGASEVKRNFNAFRGRLGM